MKKKSKRPPRPAASISPKPDDQILSLLFQAVRNSTELINLVDSQHVVTFANPAYLKAHGYEEHEIVGQSVFKLLSPRNAKTTLEQAKLQSQQDIGWRGEALSLRRDGSEFPVYISLGPLKDENGRVVGTFSIAQDITSRKQMEEQLRRSESHLRMVIHNTAKLTELVDIFQSCHSMEEAYRITRDALQSMLPGSSGALCVTTSSRNLVEAAVTWGTQPSGEKSFRPDDCWALRRGKVHIVEDLTSPLRCPHSAETSSGPLVCVPLAAHGETIGVLQLEASVDRDALDPIDRLAEQATAIGERLSLALANLRLREALRTQSIRDPLTGLFNRRYMEETLERELSRAVRHGTSVSLLMCDLDHFKRFNDTFGHQAGDRLLRSLGEFLTQRTRGQDVTCRYGGEEFAVVLTGASLEDARKRAQLLCEEVKEIIVQHAGQLLAKVSMSIGVSTFPDHGNTVEELMKAADGALYRAKSDGRDRVVMVS
jgi:diguanylate cyclase (GGDEF)-like protein/PAS domain S-box-containing protein